MLEICAYDEVLTFAIIFQSVSTIRDSTKTNKLAATDNVILQERFNRIRNTAVTLQSVHTALAALSEKDSAASDEESASVLSDVERFTNAYAATQMNAIQPGSGRLKNVALSMQGSLMSRSFPF